MFQRTDRLRQNKRRRSSFRREQLSSYFPRHTRDIQVVESPGFRRLTLSLAESAIIAGVIVRLLRAVVLTYGPSTNWLYLASGIMLGALVLFGMTALHLANFTLRHWVWRAPVFALAESAAEMAVSVVLTLLGREPFGTSRATIDQIWTLAGRTFLGRTVAVCLFAALLAGVIQIARRIVIAQEPNARAAESLRAELFSDAPEPDIDRSQAS
jgi:hypothetical protein